MFLTIFKEYKNTSLIWFLEIYTKYLPSKHETLNANPSTAPCKKILLSSLGMVAHACNPSYLGGENLEDHGSRPAWAKKLARPHQNKYVSMVAHTSNASYVGGISRRIVVQTSPGKKN
jgi:hypothetical protein